MTWMEKKYSSEKEIRFLCDELSSLLALQYKKRIINDSHGERVCFELPNGEICHPFVMIGRGFNNLAMEYADNIEEMKKYNTEDGDLYKPEMFASKEDMFEAILQEVKGA